MEYEFATGCSGVNILGQASKDTVYCFSVGSLSSSEISVLAWAGNTGA